MRIDRIHLTGWMLAAVCLALPSQPARAQTVSKTHLMWHLTPAEGATPELAGRVEKLIRARFGELHPAALMDGMTMDSILLVEGNEKFLRCGTGAGCLSGLGKLAGMRFVITGEVALAGGRTTTRLMLVDVAKQASVIEASVDSAGMPGQAQLDELAVAMFRPEQYTGAIVLSVPVAGAQVLLDGKPAGVTPLPGPLAQLVAGDHLVEVKKAGHQPYSRTVRVPMGKSVRLVALLPEVVFSAGRPRPFYKDWPFWTAVGIGAAALGVAGGLHYDANVLQANADKLRENHLEGAEAEQDRADARYLQTYVLYGIGGAGLLAAGLIAIIDLASGPGAAGDAASEPAAVRFEVAPAVQGLGACATLRF
jgi:hypothetical protein